MTNRVILNSGGMDSFFGAMRVRDAQHVFVDIAQRYRRKERLAATRIADQFGATLHVVTAAPIAQFEHKESGIIPLRNAEMILQAAQYGNEIYLGILANEVNSDKSPEFLRAMELVMDISCRAQYWSKGTLFHLHTPLGTRSKAHLVRTLWDSVDRDPNAGLWKEMLATVSCYDGGDHHCGECASCFKRWVALTVATEKDGVEWNKFVVHPAEQHPLKYWQAKNYATDRIREIENAYNIAQV